MRKTLKALGVLAFAVSVQAVAAGPAAAGTPQLSVTPTSGPGGTSVAATGTGFCPRPCSPVELDFAGRPVKLAVDVSSDGTFRATFTVPSSALGGVNVVYASQTTSSGGMQQANTRFTVTPSQPAPASSAPSSSSSTPAHTAAPPASGTPRQTTSSGSTPTSSAATPTVKATTSSGSSTPSAGETTSGGSSLPGATSTPAATERKTGHPAVWATAAALAVLAAVGGALALRTWRARRNP